MSSIKKLSSFIFIGFLLLNFFSCTEKKNLATHGMSNLPISQFSYMGPVERTINLKLILEKNKLNSSATIKAIIELPYDYNFPLQYKWKLGQKVTLQKGEQLTGTISAIKKNEPIEILLTVDNFQTDNSKDKRFVRFEIIGINSEKRIFADGIVSSQQENSFESIVQEVESIHANK